MLSLNIQDRFNKELPSDPELINARRQVHDACFSYVTPRVSENPKLIHASSEVADLLSLNYESLESEAFLDVFSGSKVIDGTQPYAMNYGGHQFGQWAGQLGDGRAINLMEVCHMDQSWAIQLKGAGETPYSRTADGLAVLRSSIREHLCSEAMHHLGVPTTRSLSLMLTGDDVLRDMMYDGNSTYEKGAVVCRVSPSFIRFGSFEIFAQRKEYNTLRALADFTIKHHFPAIDLSSKDRYTAFFQEVCDRTLEMVIHWQRVGFVHGVMNTDNMSILGLTIDYGPYGWLEGYDPGWTPNTTDRQSKRYRFGHQPQIALWNLWRLANALFPLIEKEKSLQESLTFFQKEYPIRYTSMMRNKLGLATVHPNDGELIVNLERVLQRTETDMTIFFRLLADIPKDELTNKPVLTSLNDAFYEEDQIAGPIKEAWTQWLSAYKERLDSESNNDAQRKAIMNAVNPKYVLRNYMAQLVIDAANKGDYALLEDIHQMLKRPYDAQPEFHKWFSKRPEWARHKVGCSMLSCSS